MARVRIALFVVVRIFYVFLMRLGLDKGVNDEDERICAVGHCALIRNSKLIRRANIIARKLRCYVHFVPYRAVGQKRSSSRFTQKKFK